MTPLPVLLQDPWLVVVHKPAGLLLHRSSRCGDRRFLLQMARDQLGFRLYPVHRLDRATSGVVLFARDADTARTLSEQFRKRSVEKVYHAVVRGFAPAQDRVEHPLRPSREAQPKAAVTDFRCLARVELPIPVGRYATARYSLLEVRPHSGRRHQIRRHLAYRSHPLVGDTMYGKGEHNRLFRREFGVYRLLLIAVSLGFIHPVTAARVTVATEYDPEIAELFGRLGWPCTVR